MRVRGAPQSTRSALLWTGGLGLSRQLVQFAGSLVLARLLEPAQFGLAAVALAITVFGQIFTDLGIRAAVVQRAELTRTFLATAFWLNLVTGLVLTGGLVALSHPLAQLARQPELADLLILGSLTFTLSFAAVHQALLERAMQFRRIASVELIGSAIGLAVTVTGASTGLGVTSLVAGPVAATLAVSLGLVASTRFHPDARGSRQDLRDLWAFSWGLVGFNALNYWSRNADNLLIGRFLGVEPLGFYARAYSLMMLPMQQLGTAVTRVLLPGMSRLSSDLDGLRDHWLRAVRAAWVVGLPVAVGMSVAAPALVEVLFSRRWLPTAPLLALLALSLPAQLIGRTVGAVYQALGDTRRQFVVGLWTAASSVAAVAASLPFGSRGVAAAVFAALTVNSLVATAPVLHRVGGSWSGLLRPLLPSACGGLAMAGACLLVRRALEGSSAWAVLVAEAAVGASVYICWLIRFDRASIGLLVRRT